jgi:hypothetical protein
VAVYARPRQQLYEQHKLPVLPEPRPQLQLQLPGRRVLPRDELLQGSGQLRAKHSERLELAFVAILLPSNIHDIYSGLEPSIKYGTSSPS